MGVEIRLTDKELPISPMVIEFLDQHLRGAPVSAEWHDQVTERLVPAEPEARIRYAEAVAQRVLDHPEGSRAIYRAYELLAAITIGTASKLQPVHDRYRFVCVVGCPRHGGTYLTKALFRAIGMDPALVPNVIAHDGFPDLSPFLFTESFNVHTAMTQQMAEYLAMVELYFRGAPAKGGHVVVPKKATKAAYHGAFFNQVLGPATEYIVTLRHPVPACISTYEKSGGLPADGRFAKRSNIEQWAVRDQVWLGRTEGDVLAQDYFGAYLAYWERYHYSLALSGLAGNANVRFIAYGAERLQRCAREFQDRFGGSGAVEAFHASRKADRHADWFARADQAMRRVAAIWSTVGWRLPLNDLMEMH